MRWSTLRITLLRNRSRHYVQCSTRSKIWTKSSFRRCPGSLSEDAAKHYARTKHTSHAPNTRRTALSHSPNMSDSATVSLSTLMTQRQKTSRSSTSLALSHHQSRETIPLICTRVADLLHIFLHRGFVCPFVNK